MLLIYSANGLRYLLGGGALANFGSRILFRHGKCREPHMSVIKRVR